MLVLADTLVASIDRKAAKKQHFLAVPLKNPGNITCWRRNITCVANLKRYVLAAFQTSVFLAATLLLLIDRKVNKTALFGSTPVEPQHHNFLAAQENSTVWQPPQLRKESVRFLAGFAQKPNTIIL